MQQRLQYIDISKGIAILSVVIGHVLCYDLYGFDRAWTDSSLCQIIYSFHMPLFIFLSGLVSVTTIEYKQIPIDICKRFRSILVPGLVVGTIYSLYMHHDLSFVFSDMKYGYWYLWVLFVFYLLNYIPVKIAMGGAIKQTLTYLSLIIIWIVANHYVYLVPEVVNDTFSLGFIVSYYPYYILANTIKRHKLRHRLFNSPLALIVASTVWLFSSYIHFKFSSYFVTTAAIITIINICSSIERTMSKPQQLLSYLGKNSLYIYIFHYFALQWFKTTYFYDILPNYSNLGWDFLLCFLPTTICILFSIGVGKVIESYPAINNILFNKTNF